MELGNEVVDVIHLAHPDVLVIDSRTSLSNEVNKFGIKLLTVPNHKFLNLKDHTCLLFHTLAFLNLLELVKFISDDSDQ